MEFQEKLLIALLGAIITIVIKFFAEKWSQAQRLNNQRKLLIDFIDDIIIRYCNVNVAEYDKVIEYFNEIEAKIIAESPMLNRHIIDYFSKNDLVKIFSVSKSKFTDFYNYLYEIEFLSNQCPSLLSENFFNFINNQVKLTLEKDNIPFTNKNIVLHIKTCTNCQLNINSRIENIKLQKAHYNVLKTNFIEIKDNLKNGRLKFWLFRFLFK
jgi:hypothetical protein